MASLPPWQSVLDELFRQHERLHKTLIWLEESEYQTELPPTGQTPVQLMETLCHQHQSIVHEVQAYGQEKQVSPPPLPSLTADFQEDCYRNLLYFQDRLAAVANARLPVHLHDACRQLTAQVASAQSQVAAYWYSLARWGRTALRAFVAEQFDLLLDSVGGLPEEALCEQVVAGTWTARDILAHVLSWEEFGWEILHQWPSPAPRSLQPWAYDDMDQANRDMVHARSHLDLIDLMGDLYTYRRRTLQFIDACSEEALTGTGSYGWDERGTLVAFLLQMAQHRNEHAHGLWTARNAGQLS